MSARWRRESSLRFRSSASGWAGIAVPRRISARTSAGMSSRVSPMTGDYAGERGGVKRAPGPRSPAPDRPRFDLPRGCERLVEVGENVVDMLQPDREAHIARRDAGCRLLFFRKLRVGGRRRVDGEAAGIADIGDVEEQLQRVDEGPPRLLAAREFEADQRAVAAVQIGRPPGAGPRPSSAPDRSSSRPWRGGSDNRRRRCCVAVVPFPFAAAAFPAPATPERRSSASSPSRDRAAGWSGP